MKSELTIKWNKRQWCRYGVFIENFKQISHIVLVLTLLTWNKYMPTLMTAEKVGVPFLFLPYISSSITKTKILAGWLL